MVGPKDIQNRPLPGQFQRPATTQAPSTGKKSPAGQAHDAARVAQGAGFVRQGVQKKKAGDASDPLSGQLVLPESELDLDAQSMAALKSCLERTEGMAAQLGGLQGNDSNDAPQGLCESLVGFTPDNQLRLEALEDCVEGLSLLEQRRLPLGLKGQVGKEVEDRRRARLVSGAKVALQQGYCLGDEVVAHEIRTALGGGGEGTERGPADSPVRLGQRRL